MWEIRTITPEDADVFRSRIASAFGHDADDSEEARERFRETFEYDRTFAALDEGEVVGTCSAFSLDVTVPGGASVPMGGTTVVSVLSTHRRRGILKALMKAHLQDVSEREEPLAGLWASEAPIYGRFGYGPATFRYKASIDGTLVDPDVGSNPGSLRIADVDEAKKVVPGLYDASRATGMLSRSAAWWTHRVFADPETWRGGKSARRWVIHETEGEPTGYASYRQKGEWDDSVAKGEVDVVELVAKTTGARLALWRFLTSIDLFPRVEHWNMALDDPLIHATSDFRRIKRTVADALWVKLMDIPRALEARTYETDGRIAFAVDGDSFVLEVVAGKANCERIDGGTDLELSGDVLGHLYLGGGSGLGMAAAGRISGDKESVTALHRLFRTDAAPWCNEVF